MIGELKIAASYDRKDRMRQKFYCKNERGIG